MSSPTHVSEAVVLHPDDNVGTIRRIHSEEAGTCLVALGAETRDQQLPASVPFGHKIALVAIATGEPITKYGQRIGIATEPIAAGEHVHVHNVVGGRDTGQAYAAAAAAAGTEAGR